MGNIKGLIAAVAVATQLIYALPVYAHGVVYDTKQVEENKLRITLKWSNPNKNKGIRIAFFNIKNGKTVKIGYEEIDNGQTYTSMDIDLAGAIPPVRINLIPAGEIDYSVFTDIKGIESEEYITHLHDAGIVNGREEDRFLPEESITRAEFATLVVKALQLEGIAENDRGFTDIHNHWAENTMLLASKNGLISGYEDKTLKPDNNITVAEACALINRAFKFKTVNNGYYSHVRQGMWYSGAVKQMFDSGILRVTDGVYKNFDEEIYINRADCAMMISRALSTY